MTAFFRAPIVLLLAPLIAFTAALGSTAVASGSEVAHPEAQRELQVNPKEPGFWSRNYSIPSFYQTLSIRLRISDRRAAEKRIAAALQFLGGRRLYIQTSYRFYGNSSTQFPGDNQMIWSMPTDNTPKALKSFLSVGKFLSVKPKRKPDEPIPAYPELGYKLDHLNDESPTVRKNAEKMPGITALLEMELETLRNIIEADTSARQYTRLLITLEQQRDPEPPSYFQDWPETQDIPRLTSVFLVGNQKRPNQVEVSTVTRRFPFNYWARRAIPDSCNPSPGVIQVIVATRELTKTERRVRKRLRRHHAAEYHPSCTMFSMPQPMPTFAYSTGPVMNFELASEWLTEIQKDLASAGTLVSWGALDASDDRRSLLTAAAERIAILKAESAVNAEVLSEVPHLKALVEAEIERLAPYAQRYEAIRHKTFLSVALIRIEGIYP